MLFHQNSEHDFERRRKPFSQANRQPRRGPLKAEVTNVDVSFAARRRLLAGLGPTTQDELV